MRLICTPALAPAAPMLVSDFQRISGHTVSATYATVGAMQQQLSSGDAADVGISVAPVVDELIARGIMAGSPRVDIARIGIGVQVRRGAPKPDIASIEAFKQVMLTARTIGYIDPAGGGAAGIHVRQVLGHLGIAQRVAHKTRLIGGDALLRAVASGEVAIGLAPISEILSEPGVELVGALPQEIQDVTVLTAALLAGSRENPAAKAFIEYLITPAATAMLRARGLQQP